MTLALAFAALVSSSSTDGPWTPSSAFALGDRGAFRLEAQNGADYFLVRNSGAYVHTLTLGGHRGYAFGLDWFLGARGRLGLITYGGEPLVLTLKQTFIQRPGFALALSAETVPGGIELETAGWYFQERFDVPLSIALGPKSSLDLAAIAVIRAYYNQPFHSLAPGVRVSVSARLQSVTYYIGLESLLDFGFDAPFHPAGLGPLRTRTNLVVGFSRMSGEAPEQPAQ
jgi:hypothetical protein